MKVIFNFIIEHWYTIGPGIYELVARLFPTKKNLSVIDALVKFVGIIIPNKRKV